MSDVVTIHYHRPPDRYDVYVQRLLHADESVVISLLPNAEPIIWFTFAGCMHDIGRFHTASGEFTGLYADILLPVEIASPHEISLTDLFLDIWIPLEGAPVILDEAELAEAVAHGWVSDETAAAAHAEAERLLALHQQGLWPPAIVNEWTLARVSGG